MRSYMVETVHCGRCNLWGPWHVLRAGTPMADDVLYDCGGDGHIIDVSDKDEHERWKKCPQCKKPLSGQIDNRWFDDDNAEAFGGRGALFIWAEESL